MRNFFSWWSSEMKARGYSPGNWKWILPPMSASTSRCYLELNKMTEYTLKPVSCCHMRLVFCTCFQKSRVCRQDKAHR
jgi:hypothetical protein